MSQAITDDTPVVPLDMRLRRLLADHRMSGRRLAEATGIHRATLARVLRGTRDLTIGELQQIAAVFDVDPADLIRDLDGRAS